MNYKCLGKTGIRVSSLCLGTMTFGGNADTSTSKKLFYRCRDKGINFFDCANVYNGGRAEKILGQLIQDCRDEVIISSKVYFPQGRDPNARGASRHHILRAVEASLKRLKTDYIDIYYIHRFDEITGLEETLRTLDDLVRQGKIIYLGASNFAAWQIMKSIGISNKFGWNPFQCIQPMYSLIKRQAEVELFPMAQSEGLGVITYSPLGAGLLTGKYMSQRQPRTGRLLKVKHYQVRFGEDWMKEVAERYFNFSKSTGFSPASLAIAWTAAHPAVTAPIIGARNLSQLNDCLKSLDIKMSDDLWDHISSLAIEPPPATDRSEEGKI